MSQKSSFFCTTNCKMVSNLFQPKTRLLLNLECFQSVAQFLAGLPSYNENNFSKFHSEGSHRSSAKRPSVYTPTRDIPSQQSKLIKAILLNFYLTIAIVIRYIIMMNFIQHWVSLRLTKMIQFNLLSDFNNFLFFNCYFQTQL